MEGRGGSLDADETDLTSMSTQVDLPRDLLIAEFARHRARELATLTACVEVTPGNKRIFQQLPRHMRRRSQSYNVRRVPRRIQELHRRELEKVSGLSAKNVKKKPPSRRHRRRPRHLLLEYNRRQREFIWLETHVWHAKRFRMSQRWGYKIPLHPCDKSVRACYKGATRTALLQDLSYHCCIEIVGEGRKIVDILRQMTSAKCGLTFEAMRHDAGECEGRIVLYARNRYPYAAIGEAKFMWRPPPLVASVNSNDCSSKRRLWIWVHPACHEEVLSELIDGFKLHKISDRNDRDGLALMEVEAPEGDAIANEKLSLLLKDKTFLKLEPKLRSFYERSPIYVGGGADGESEVTLKVLKDNLIRLRLFGQLSTAILTDVLRVTFKDDDEVGRGIETASFWWQNPNKFSPKTLSRQCKFWEEVGKRPFSIQFPPNCIVGLTVCDPRECLRSDKSKFFPDVPDVCQFEFASLRLPSGVSDSPLWDQATRDEVTFSKMTDHDINKQRSQHLVPGTPLNLGDRGSRIPVILIQNPGNQASTSTSDIDMGWDIILPAGWAMPFWISLVYRNARVGGLREGVAMAHQSHSLHFPEDFPDTLACQRDDTDVCSQLTKKYFAYPPDKRPNYLKMGVVSPFRAPWRILTEEWSKLTCDVRNELCEGSESDFFVMRDRAVLRSLQYALRDERGVGKKRWFDARLADVNLNDLLTTFNSHSIVAIRLKMFTKGSVSEFAQICIPSEKDLKEFNANPSYCGPREPSHRDKAKALRRKLRNECKSTRKKKSLVEETGDALNSEVRERLRESKAIKKQEIQMLCIPQVDNIVKTCSRDIIGFVKSGNFSYSEGRVTGVAFVSLPGLVKLIVAVRHNPIVLLRQTNSDQYRFAAFSVLL